MTIHARWHRGKYEIFFFGASFEDNLRDVKSRLLVFYEQITPFSAEEQHMRIALDYACSYLYGAIAAKGNAK
jgi:hypothetical protein